MIIEGLAAVWFGDTVDVLGIADMRSGMTVLANRHDLGNERQIAPGN